MPPAQHTARDGSSSMTNCILCGLNTRLSGCDMDGVVLIGGSLFFVPVPYLLLWDGSLGRMFPVLCLPAARRSSPCRELSALPARTGCHPFRPDRENPAAHSGNPCIVCSSGF